MAASYVIGIDLGGTKIRAGIFRSSDVKLIKKITVPTRVEGGKKTVISDLETIIGKIIRKNTVGIGIGVAGIIDVDRGIVVSGPNLPKDFRRVALGRMLKKKFAIPVKVENDARCFTLAEALKGAGAGCDGVFGLTLGTGIGGGFFRDGRLVRGLEAAGEIGHLPVADELPGHDPSKTIDLEHVASGRGLETTYAELSGRRLDCVTIERRFRTREKAARETFRIGQHALAKGLASAQLLFDPECIVIGGGLGRSERYWKPAVGIVRAKAFPSLKRIRVKKSKLGADAGMIGAALLHSYDTYEL